VRTWKRVPIGLTVKCGRCGEVIAQAAPVLVITIDRVHRTLDRCEAVACGGPAPPDLPPLLERVIEPAPAFVPVRQLLPLDWRTRAADREPGMEG
jgi:hypothetical protein